MLILECHLITQQVSQNAAVLPQFLKFFEKNIKNIEIIIFNKKHLN
jgi:hypothetical protein